MEAAVVSKIDILAEMRRAWNEWDDAPDMTGLRDDDINA